MSAEKQNASPLRKDPKGYRNIPGRGKYWVSLSTWDTRSRDWKHLISEKGEKEKVEKKNTVAAVRSNFVYSLLIQ